MPSTNVLALFPRVRRGRVLIERLEYGEPVGHPLQPDAEFVSDVVGCANPACSWKKTGRGMRAANSVQALVSAIVAEGGTTGTETEGCGGVVITEEGWEVGCPRQWRYTVRIEYR